VAVSTVLNSLIRKWVYVLRLALPKATGRLPSPSYFILLVWLSGVGRGHDPRPDSIHD